MSHRPYPSTDRALRQLGRHHHPAFDEPATPQQIAARTALDNAARFLGPRLASMGAVLATGAVR